jgi:hypothetical protein
MVLGLDAQKLQKQRKSHTSGVTSTAFPVWKGTHLPQCVYIGYLNQIPGGVKQFFRKFFPGGFGWGDARRDA